jgi:uncharacterized protein YlxW (UPF0749 family)
MNENEQPVRSISGTLIAAVAVAFLLGAGALVWCYGLQNHLAATEQKLAASDRKNADLSDQLDATNARLRATAETLGQSVGMTQKQIDTRAASIMAAQRVASAQTAKLEQAQQATEMSPASRLTSAA